MKVDAKALHRAIKNATIYSRPKGWAGGLTKFDADFLSLVLRVTTSEDFVGVETTVPYVGNYGGTFYLEHKQVKDLEVALRDKEGEVEVDVVDGHLNVNPLVWSDSLTFEPDDEGWWNMFNTIMTRVNADPEVRGPWELNPARLSKMNLLEPKDEYPISFSPCRIGDQRFIAFRYGPNTVGMIAPLDRQALKEAFSDDLETIVW